MKSDIDSPPPSKLLDLLRLLRAPNVFTAIADVAMGYLFVRGKFASIPEFAGLAFASCSMYLAGMVLNDVFDLEIDRVERPDRPLPSGRISFGFARGLGFGLLLVGVAAAWLVGFLADDALAPWRPGAVATLLAAAILTYDGGLKKTLVSPVAMGLCRFLNVLLGMSLLPAAAGESETIRWATGGYSTPELVTAAGIGVYIAGVTIFAKSEAEESRRAPLVAGLAVMFAGIGLLATGPSLEGAKVVNPLWLVILAMVSITLGRRCVAATANPEPMLVQRAVKISILSLIPLNAAVCAARADSALAIGVALLLLPAFALGRWVYST